MPHPHLVIFTRYPVPGRAKTRLIPALGDDGAARLHRHLAERAVGRALAVELPGLRRAVWFTGGSAEQMRAWLGEALELVAQPAGDLGERMLSTFARSAAEGHDQTVIVGTDVPDLTVGILARSFDLLADHDVVLGPSADGGYYLIGARCPHPPLFSGIAWSTDAVLQQTVDRARDASLSVAFLPTLRDIDRPEDLDEAGDLL